MIQFVLAFFACVAIAFAAQLPEEVRHVKRAGCAQDNCYNAYTHSLSIASPFCSTYIRSTTTVTVAGPVAGTGAPTFAAVTTNTQLSSRCMLDVNSAGVQSTSLSLRLSSACSCISVAPSPTVTITVTTTAAGPPQNPSASCAAFAATLGPSQDYQGMSVEWKVTCGETADCHSNGVTLPPDTSYNFKACIDACDAGICALVNYIYDPTKGTYTCNQCDDSLDILTADVNGATAVID